MKTSDTRVLFLLHRLPVKTVRQIVRKWAVSRIRGAATSRSAMEADGYVAVEVDGPLTDDGREVVVVNGQRWALRPDIHAGRLAAELAAAKKAKPEAETKSVVGTESLSAMVCPKCGDSLQHTTVCPKCAAGKLGYRHRYTCACGGVDLISKEAL